MSLKTHKYKITQNKTVCEKKNLGNKFFYTPLKIEIDREERKKSSSRR